jgi:hypothetical protein
MALTLSLLALVVTVTATISAWRARAACHRLALEMVHLRDRLSKAETAREAAEARASHQPAAAAADPHVRERLDLVEQRLREVSEREVSRVVAPDDDTDLRTQITRRLQRDGYERIAFLEAAGDGSILVEAERGGSTTKGRAELRADGQVRLTSISSYRAFP